MSNKTKIVLLAVVALIIGIVIGAMFAPSSNLGSVRVITDQYVNGLDVIGSGTSTLRVKSTSPSGYGCIEMGNGSDSIYMAAVSSGTAVWESGTCE